MKSIGTIVTGTANILAVAGLSLLLLLALFTLFDGLLRAFANYPLDFVREIGDLIAAISATCCLPMTLLHRNNITLRIFEKILPAPGARIFDVFADILIQIVMIAMAWQFYLFSMKSLRAGDVTWLLNIPTAPFWFVVDAIMWIAAAVQVFILFQSASGASFERSEESAL